MIGVAIECKKCKGCIVRPMVTIEGERVTVFKSSKTKGETVCPFCGKELSVDDIVRTYEGVTSR